MTAVVLLAIFVLASDVAELNAQAVRGLYTQRSVVNDAFIVESEPDIACTATGTDAVCIGDGAVAGDDPLDNAVLAIGASSTATGIDSIALGHNSDATQSGAIAIGGSINDASSADATGTNAIALGSNTLANDTDTVAIGANAEATGPNALAIGDTAFATGQDTIALGRNTDAGGGQCIAIGGAAVDTDSADCSAPNTVALGQSILASTEGEFAYASGSFTTQSDAHTSIYVLRNITTDGAQTELFADESAADLAITLNCTAAFRINVVARRTDVQNAGAAYFFEGAIDNNGGTTALIGSVGKVVVAEDTAAWDATVTADNVNDGINVLVTGEAAKTIRWVARAEITEACTG